MERITISLLKAETNCHPIFQFGFVRFVLLREEYDRLTVLLKEYSIEARHLNPLASKLFELKRRKIGKRERRITTTIFRPHEYRMRGKLIEILKTQPIEKLSFVLKKYSSPITVREEEFLEELREFILDSHDPMITAQIHELGREKAVVRNKSRLISEELEDFLPSTWPQGRRTRFIAEFYRLTGVAITKDALKKRRKSTRQ
ncbi:MAG: hypothetical protein JNN04_12320 [Cyclobacteriaceae bacterium]|nr:hypothetical protein [Cyclobacteriaceae bacterium]